MPPSLVWRSIRRLGNQKKERKNKKENQVRGFFSLSVDKYFSSRPLILFISKMVEHKKGHRLRLMSAAAAAADAAAAATVN